MGGRQCSRLQRAAATDSAEQPFQLFAEAFNVTGAELGFQFESLTGTPFTSVLNAITGAGPGFNPLWQEVQIVFKNPVTGAPPRLGSSQKMTIF